MWWTSSVGSCWARRFPPSIRCWDGSEALVEGAPTLVVRHRRALRRLVYAPGESGLARAYLSGDLDVAGDLYAALTSPDGLPSRPELHVDRRALARLVGRCGSGCWSCPAPPMEWRAPVGSSRYLPRRRGGVRPATQNPSGATHRGCAPCRGTTRWRWCCGPARGAGRAGRAAPARRRPSAATPPPTAGRAVPRARAARPGRTGTRGVPARPATSTSSS